MGIYIQKSTPPPNRVLTFSLQDFSGGMNNRSDQIADNEGAVVKNLMFADDTVLETRYGQKYYDEKDVIDPIIFIDEFKPYKEANILIRATATKIYFGDVEYPLQGIPNGVNHQGKYYFSDGKMLKVYGKFDDTAGTYIRLVGTPITTYEVYDIVSPADGHTQLTTEHTQGVKVVDYTTKKVFYEPCKNEFEDALKGANKISTSIKYLVSHSDRLYVSGNEEDDDNVFISDELNPIYYPVSLPIQLPPNSEKITGMHVFDDAVLVGRQSDIHSITGTTNNPNLGLPVFKRKRLNTHTGFASHSAIDIAHNYLIFLGTDGNVYGLQSSTTDLRELATIILSKTIDLTRYPIEVVKEDYSSAVSSFYNDEWFLTVGNKTMVYNYRHMAWVMLEGLNMKSIYGKDGEWLWGRPEGRIAMFDKENFKDFGEPYQSLWYSKPFDMDDANSFKQFREFFLVAHTYENYLSDIYVTFEVDYADVKNRAILSNQISKWGVARFGDRYITRNINESLPFVIGQRGRNIRFKITNNHNLDSIVESYSDLENYPEKREGLLVKLSTGEYYLYTNREWTLLDSEATNQRMKVYQVNGDYEMRGKR